MLSPQVLLYLATRPWEFGDVATWVGAGANVATLVLASVAAMVSYRIYKVESGRDARAEQDRHERAMDERRTQAALVSTWYGRSDSATERHRGIWPTYRWGGWIVNASDSPIYAARISFYRLTSGELIWAAPELRVVPPYRGELLVQIDGEVAEPLTDDEYQTEVEVSLQFRDAAGRWWLRDRLGYLRELPTSSEVGPDI